MKTFIVVVIALLINAVSVSADGVHFVNHATQAVTISSIGGAVVGASSEIDLSESELSTLRSCPEFMGYLYTGSDIYQMRNSQGVLLSTDDGVKMTLGTVDMLPHDSSGIPYSRSKDNPDGTHMCYQGVSDASGKIGGGVPIIIDVSDPGASSLILPATTTEPGGYVMCSTDETRYRLEWTYSTPIYIKGGSGQVVSVSAVASIDWYVVCPAGSIYLDPNGVITGATAAAFGLDPKLTWTMPSVDTPVQHFLNSFHTKGDYYINAEQYVPRSDLVPAGWKFWLEVTVPNGTSDFWLAQQIKIYRKSTYVLPGSTVDQ